MANYENMRLCGGTFLVLLFEAKGQRRNTRVGEGRSSDGKSNPDIFKNLVRTVNPKFQVPSGRSFNTFTSDYKLCRSSNSPSAGLTDAFLINQFDHDIKTKYYECLGLFHGRLERAIDFEMKGTWLVAALIDLIEADDTIPDDELFYIRPYGHTVKKSELRNLECICIPSFILGVWHYIITHVRDNTVGADTIDQLLETKTESRSERKFISNIGNKTISEIKTSVQPPEWEYPYYHNPELETATEDIPFAYIMPGVAVDVRNIIDGHIYVNDKQVFYMDVKEHDTIPSYDTTPFDTYLNKATQFYSKVKTLLYSEVPQNFYDFYVQNDVVLKSASPHYNNIKSKSIETLVVDQHGNIVIRGTGGIGKTMMMRHLFLHFSGHFKEKSFLPILVPLKNFTNHITNLEKFIYNAMHAFDHDLKFEDFESILKMGQCLILLDGLDEIPTNARHHFDDILANFTKAYPKNHMVISSRPTSTFIQFGNFLVFDIQPFSKSKALELIDKLDYYNLEAKLKFREDLNTKLYNSHKQFASNPLLLTLMLMTYTSYGDIPVKYHVFYSKAYETLARLHDATKGSYVRPMHTELSPEDFAIYFSEFCARTYKDEILEFDNRIFTLYMEKVLRHQKTTIQATPRDFLLDLTENLCIMYKEGEYYYFIHRSFQEYFTAVFFSNQMDDQLERIGDFFENQRHRQFGDRTFGMLYDMIPNRINRYVFIPFLNKLWKKCDEGNGYWTFLMKMYPVIYAQKGSPGDVYEHDPASYLYNFIVNESLNRHNGELHKIQWPDSVDYCCFKKWVTVEKERFSSDGTRLKYTDTLEFNNEDGYIDINIIPNKVGCAWEIHINELIKHRSNFRDIIHLIEDDSFPLKKEYNEMRVFTEWLNQLINEKTPSDDWFDAF